METIKVLVVTANKGDCRWTLAADGVLFDAVPVCNSLQGLFKEETRETELREVSSLPGATQMVRDGDRIQTWFKFKVWFQCT